MAKGSHQTYGGWEPRICCACGNRVLVKNGIWERGLSNGGVPTARHHDCKKEGGDGSRPAAS